MRYSLYTTVAEVFHYTPVCRVDRDGTEHKNDQGWFVRLDGSYEAMFVGHEQPAMRPGDTVKLTIEACRTACDQAAS